MSDDAEGQMTAEEDEAVRPGSMSWWPARSCPSMT
jgi:hypothetical protein